MRYGTLRGTIHTVYGTCWYMVRGTTASQRVTSSTASCKYTSAVYGRCSRR
jgi:hypothetical protein